MFTRKPTKWKVKLQAKSGQTKEVEVESFWSRTSENIKDEIGRAAAIREWLKSGKPGQRTEFAALNVELVTG